MTLSQGYGVGNTDRRRVLEESTLEPQGLGSAHLLSKPLPLSPRSGCKEKFPSLSSDEKAGNCLERTWQEKQGKVIKQEYLEELETCRALEARGAPETLNPATLLLSETETDPQEPGRNVAGTREPSAPESWTRALSHLLKHPERPGHQ